MSAKYLTPLSQALTQFFIYMLVNELFLDLPPHPIEDVIYILGIGHSCYFSSLLERRRVKTYVLKTHTDGDFLN